MSKRCFAHIGFTEMFINKFLATCIVMLLCQTSWAIETVDIPPVSNSELERKLLFLDKLSTCTKHMYHAAPSGIYEVYGKQNTYCKVRWTIVDCVFPQGVYQEFAKVQKKRTLDKLEWAKLGVLETPADRDYRYLLETGNLYCTNRYSDFR